MQTVSTAAAAPTRLHPLAVAAATSVTLVSLVGAAAILGWLPSSHGTSLPVAAQTVPALPVVAQTMPAQSVAAQPAMTLTAAPVALPVQASATRFQTADGRVFEEVNPLHQAAAPQPVYKPAPAPVVHRKVVHHYVQPVRHQTEYVQQPVYASQHPVRSYVSDMHPVGTGIGAVVGGVLGNQVGGGNGKKLATVAGVLLGGYAGNEVAHDRNPLPFGSR